MARRSPSPCGLGYVGSFRNRPRSSRDRKLLPATPGTSPKFLARFVATTACLAAAPFATAAEATPDHSKVPGIVIDHLPAASGLYVGSPSIAILPDGAYVASHDHFGPKMKERWNTLTAIFRSRDRGRSWSKIADLDGQFWSTLFAHKGALYIMGVHVPGGWGTHFRALMMICVRANRDATLHVATTVAHARAALSGWQNTDATFCYTDHGNTRMTIFTRPLRSGQEVVIPQGNWTGTLVLAP